MRYWYRNWGYLWIKMSQYKAKMEVEIAGGKFIFHINKRVGQTTYNTNLHMNGWWRAECVCSLHNFVSFLSIYSVQLFQSLISVFLTNHVPAAKTLFWVCFKVLFLFDYKSKNIWYLYWVNRRLQVWIQTDHVQGTQKLTLLKHCKK